MHEDTETPKRIKVRMCKYCRSLCVWEGTYCSGRCAGQDRERRERMAKKTDVDKRKEIE